jgi:hypothetical protein
MRYRFLQYLASDGDRLVWVMPLKDLRTRSSAQSHPRGNAI